MTDDERFAAIHSRPRDEHDDYTVPCTSDDLVFLRTREEAYIRKEYPDMTGFDWACDGCGSAPRCAYAYDGMNATGDCLASK